MLGQNQRGDENIAVLAITLFGRRCAIQSWAGARHGKSSFDRIRGEVPHCHDKVGKIVPGLNRLVRDSEPHKLFQPVLKRMNPFCEQPVSAAISLTRLGTWNIVPPHYTGEDPMKHLHWKTIVAGLLFSAASAIPVDERKIVYDAAETR